jgi:hypothetical protein
MEVVLESQGGGVLGSVICSLIYYDERLLLPSVDVLMKVHGFVKLPS